MGNASPFSRASAQGKAHVSSETGMAEIPAKSAQGWTADPEQRLQPGRCGDLTPAERDQLEEERRKRLLGQLGGKGAKDKAYTVGNISEPEKPVEKEALKTVLDKQQHADEGEYEGPW